MGVEQRTLELRVLPAALAHFMAAEDSASLEGLASQLGLTLPELMHQFGHHVVAKHLFEGLHQCPAPNCAPGLTLYQPPES